MKLILCRSCTLGEDIVVHSTILRKFVKNQKVTVGWKMNLKGGCKVDQVGHPHNTIIELHLTSRRNKVQLRGAVKFALNK